MDDKQKQRYSIVGSYISERYFAKLGGINEIAMQADEHPITKDFVIDFIRQNPVTDGHDFVYSEFAVISAHGKSAFTHAGLIKELHRDEEHGMFFSGPFQIFNNTYYISNLMAFKNHLRGDLDIESAVRKYYERTTIDQILENWHFVRSEGYRSGQEYKGELAKLRGFPVCLWWGVFDIEMAFALGQKTLEESIALLNRL